MCLIFGRKGYETMRMKGNKPYNGYCYMHQ
jgi:hypothetical protein